MAQTVRSRRGGKGLHRKEETAVQLSDMKTSEAARIPRGRRYQRPDSGGAQRADSPVPAPGLESRPACVRDRRPEDV